METLQFSLFFAALVVGYIIVHMRVARFERHLRELSGLRVIADRLHGIGELVEKVRVDRVETRLDRIDGALERLHEDLQQLVDLGERHEREGAVARVPVAPVLLPSPAASTGIQLLTTVESRLAALGYDRVRVLTDLATITPEQPVDLSVECERNEMPFKGKVVVQQGNVLDVRLQSVAQTFP